MCCTTTSHWKTAKPDEHARIEATFESDFRIVATSSAVRSMLATQGVVPETQIICGIEFDEFGLDRDPSSRDAMTLGFPSRGESFKGTKDAIAAASILHEKFGECAALHDLRQREACRPT
jgi:hypothetical protein